MYDIINNKLMDWCVEYFIDVSNISYNLSDDEYIIYVFNGKPTKCLALTYFDRVDNIRCCRIDIIDRMTNEFLFTSVLWHEFCHCEPWIKDGISDGHGKHWQTRLWRKPLYAIGQWVAKLVYGGVNI